jgi:hypothetical protein
VTDLLVADAERALLLRDGAVPLTLELEAAPVAVRLGPGGHIAVTSVSGGRGGAGPFLALHDPAGELVDIRLDVFAPAPAAFHPGGREVAYVRDVDGELREVVALDLASGAERRLAAGALWRSCAWTGDGRLLVTSADEVLLLDLVAGEQAPLWHDDVATGFQRWGQDDLYVTLDEVTAVGSDAVAWTRTWHEQGKAPRADVVHCVGGALREISGAANPRDLHGRLTTLRDGRLSAEVMGSPASAGGLRSFDWRPPAVGTSQPFEYCIQSGPR